MYLKWTFDSLRVSMGVYLLNSDWVKCNIINALYSGKYSSHL